MVPGKQYFRIWPAERRRQKLWRKWIEKANAVLYDWIELELSEDEVNLPPFRIQDIWTASEGGAAGQTDLRKYPFV